MTNWRRWCQISALLCALPLLAAETPAVKYEVKGKLVPRRRAIVVLQSVTKIFQAYSLVDLAGEFKFKKIESGAYTALIFMPRRGELRQTVEIGPGTADKKNRVTLLIRIDENKIVREPAHMVSFKAYEVKDAAKKEYANAHKEVQRGNAEKAIEHLKKAVEISPTYASAWNELGTIAYRRQDFAESERCFRKGLEADPEAYEPMVNLGGVLLNLDKPADAWDYNVRAVTRRPRDPLAHAQLGMTYMQMNRPDLAEKSLLEARKLDPAHFSHPQLFLAEITAQRGQRRRAADYLEEFLHFHPDNAAASRIQDAIKRLRSQPQQPGAIQQREPAPRQRSLEL